MASVGKETVSVMSENYCMDVEGIKERIPHRPPFLLIDGILACEPGESIVAIKDVSSDESYFQGHFPGHPVMPGVFILEALAQAGGVLVWESVAPEERNFILYLAGVEKTRFRQPVFPGVRLVLTVDLTAQRRNLWRFDGRAEVDGRVVATAEFLQAPGKTLD